MVAELRGAAIADGGGGGAESYTFEQDAPAAVWTIVHGLGFNPAVTTVDTLGREFLGAVGYVDLNTVTVTFSTAATGKAYLS